MTRTSSDLVAFYDLEPEVEDFEAAVIAGLSASPRTLPCKYFYDQRGSALFDRICELEEYYVTRTEIALLERHAAEMAGLMGRGCHLIELGSGSPRKVPLLLDALGDAAAYTAIDISRDHLLASTTALAAARPDVEIGAVCADYTRSLDLPPLKSRPDSKRVVYFPGSSVGNFAPDEARAFLRRIADMVRQGGELMIGVDLKKDPDILHAAYNDSEGVTAAFNMNLLVRINAELDGSFDLGAFSHEAFYDADEGRIEMHLRSLAAQVAGVAGHQFNFAEGERIHTENSYKYAVEEFQILAGDAGFSPLHVWIDDACLFSIHYLRVQEA